MLSNFRRPAKVTVTVEEDQLFVSPSLHPDPSAQPLGPTLRGSVLVELASPRQLKSLRVVFRGVCELYASAERPYTKTVTLCEEIEVSFGGETLEAGRYSYPFTFPISSSTTVSNRSTYGRVLHTVTAVLNLNSALLGATITSNSIPLWIVANPSALGELLHPTDLYFQHEHEDLGIVSASVSSPNFSVSALCKISLTLLCPAHDFKLVSFSAFLTQSFDLRYDDGFSTRTPSQILRLIDVDSTPSSSLQSSSTLSSNDLLTTCSSLPEPESTEQVSTHAFVPVDVPAGSHFTHSRLCRIPSDKLVRPTTLPGTDTPLRISHTCSIRVRFRENGDKEDRVIEIAKPVVVASCCCSSDSLHLPPYSLSGPPRSAPGPLESRCSCRYSVESLLERDGETLKLSDSPDPSDQVGVLPTPPPLLPSSPPPSLLLLIPPPPHPSALLPAAEITEQPFHKRHALSPDRIYALYDTTTTTSDEPHWFLFAGGTGDLLDDSSIEFKFWSSRLTRKRKSPPRRDSKGGGGMKTRTRSMKRKEAFYWALHGDDEAIDELAAQAKADMDVTLAAAAAAEEQKADEDADDEEEEKSSVPLVDRISAAPAPQPLPHLEDDQSDESDDDDADVSSMADAAESGNDSGVFVFVPNPASLVDVDVGEEGAASPSTPTLVSGSVNSGGSEKKRAREEEGGGEEGKKGEEGEKRKKKKKSKKAKKEKKEKKEREKMEKAVEQA